MPKMIVIIHIVYTCWRSSFQGGSCPLGSCKDEYPDYNCPRGYTCAEGSHTRRYLNGNGMRVVSGE